MKVGRNGYHIPGVGLVAIAITLLAGASFAFAAANGKTPSNPWADLTDQQRQAQVDAAHAANIRYLQDFEARHADPRSLPVIEVSTWLPPASSLGTAAGKATLIAHGRVSSVHFTADPSGGMPQMEATVNVIDVGKGPRASSVVVSQPGGPVAQPNGGALVELEDGHLMLPGDEVLLLLSPISGSMAYQPVYGPGVMLIKVGALTGKAAARYGVDGRDYQQVWKLLTDANISRSAFPLQDSQQ